MLNALCTEREHCIHISPTQSGNTLCTAFMYVHIYIYIYIYIFVNKYMYICIHIYEYIHALLGHKYWLQTGHLGDEGEVLLPTSPAMLNSRRVAMVSISCRLTRSDGTFICVTRSDKTDCSHGVRCSAIKTTWPCTSGRTQESQQLRDTTLFNLSSGQYLRQAKRTWIPYQEFSRGRDLLIHSVSSRVHPKSCPAIRNVDCSSFVPVYLPILPKPSTFSGIGI